MRKILILGATGTFGNSLVKSLCGNGKSYHLTLASRHATDCYRDSEECHVVDCDATKAENLRHVMKDCDVVYCAISGRDLPIVAGNIVSVMKETGVRRFIFMGAVGIYDEIPSDMDDEDNVRNNPEQVPNREAVDIVENSGLDYTILRPGYLQDGDKEDFTLTFKGEQAKGYISTISSVVEFAVRLIDDDMLYICQSISITKDMSVQTKVQ